VSSLSGMVVPERTQRPRWLDSSPECPVM
jgi:hypothetical protein